jgi:hypothetical protein
MNTISAIHDTTGTIPLIGATVEGDEGHGRNEVLQEDDKTMAMARHTSPTEKVGECWHCHKVIIRRRTVGFYILRNRRRNRRRNRPLAYNRTVDG